MLKLYPAYPLGQTASLVIAVLTLLLPGTGKAQQGALDVFMRRKLVEGRVPGLAAAIVKHNSVVWAKSGSSGTGSGGWMKAWMLGDSGWWALAKMQSERRHHTQWTQAPGTAGGGQACEDCASI